MPRTAVIKFLAVCALAAIPLALASCTSPLQKNRELGIKLYNENQFDQSLATLNRALSYDQFDAQSNTYAGLIEYRAGKYEQAAYHFKVALQSDPSSEKAKDGLTETLIKMGKPDLALDALERSASLAERVNDPRWKRSNVKRHYDSQVQENLYADKVDDRLRIARAYEKLGDYDNAVLFYKKAIELHPRSAGAMLALANLYAKLGNRDQARAYWVRAYEIDPTTPGLTESMTHYGVAISDLYGTPSASQAPLPAPR